MNNPNEHNLLSIVVPAYNEQENLPLLYNELVKALPESDHEIEIIIVDDHSGDETFKAILTLAEQDRRVRGLRLARNSGSHKAILCGLRETKGNCAIVIAADMQDPPSTIPEMIGEWKKGAQIVWAVRSSESGEAAIGFSSRLYYWMMRHVFGVSEMPGTGADFFLLDRRVIEALNNYNESNSSVLGLLMWMGFRQSRVYYEKQERHSGISGWTLRMKLKLLVDSITSFSYLPVRVMSLIGFLVSLIGFLYAIVVVVNALLGRPGEGWSSLMMVLLIVGGLQMLMLGILGEYLWRALDESRRRPLYMIEADTKDFNQVN